MLTVQLPPAVLPPPAGSEHVKCSALTSRHRFQPVTVVEAEATNRLSDTVAVDPQLVPTRQVEKATPVADAHETLVPNAPVRFSVFKSFVPTCENKGST